MTDLMRFAAQTAARGVGCVLVGYPQLRRLEQGSFGGTRLCQRNGHGGDGGDCINDEAQVFAVGPAAAWNDAGYVAASASVTRVRSAITIGGYPGRDEG